MQFGLKNILRSINNVLNDLQIDFLYVDDIFSTFLHELIENLPFIFWKLREVIFKILSAKFEFLRREIDFL